MSELNMVQQMLPMVQTQVQTKSARSKSNDNAVESFENLMSKAVNKKDPKPAKTETPMKSEEPAQETKPKDTPVVKIEDEDKEPVVTVVPDTAILMNLVVQPHPDFIPVTEEQPVLQVTAELPVPMIETQPTENAPTAVPTQVQTELPKAEFKSIEMPKLENEQAPVAAQTAEKPQQPVVAQNSVMDKETVQKSEELIPAIESKTDDGEETGRTTLVGELAKKPVGTERLNIKVGENFDIQKPEFPQQVAEKILYSVKDGVQDLQIQLTPHDLGEINIHVVVENGKAVVTMACANPKTQELLNEHLGSLKSILENNTGNQTVINVEKQDQQMYQRENYEGHSGNQQRQEQQDSQKPKADEVNIFIDQLRMGMKITTMY